MSMLAGGKLHISKGGLGSTADDGRRKVLGGTGSGRQVETRQIHYQDIVV